MDIVDVAEIANRAGTTPGTVHSWRVRHADFPEPFARLRIGPVWQWHEVEKWLAKPRSAGRPKG